MELSKEDLVEMYKNIIIENTRDKTHKKEIEGIEKEGINPSCGDELKIFVKMNEDNSIIQEISFTGRGCAISEYND